MKQDIANSAYITFYLDHGVSKVDGTNQTIGTDFTFQRDTFKLRRCHRFLASEVMKEGTKWPFQYIFLSVWQDTTDGSWWAFYIDEKTQRTSDVGNPTSGDMMRHCATSDEIYVARVTQYVEGIAALSKMHPRATANRPERPGLGTPEITRPGHGVTVIGEVVGTQEFSTQGRHSQNGSPDISR